jgi:hypothetical protein
LRLATSPDATNAGGKDGGYGRGRYRQRCIGPTSYDHGYATADEIGCKRRQPIILILRMTILDHYVLAVHEAGFPQALKERNGGDLSRQLGNDEGYGSSRVGVRSASSETSCCL